jgi:hypothetical protein
MQYGKQMLKSIDRLGPYAMREEAFMSLMEDSYSHDVKRPSSLSSLFHAKFYTPRLKRGVNATFDYAFTGAWEEARMKGALTGLWRQYDLNSAYLWSGAQGLPDTSTFRFADALDARIPGLYNIEQCSIHRNLPYPFNVKKIVNATTDEIDAYGLQVKKVFGGYTWRKHINGDKVVEAVKTFRAWKHIGKIYWGRWCSRSSTYCHAKSGSVWPTPNMALNLVWAHVVISRVKMRIWDDAKGAAHIFVDSVIVPHELPESDDIGGWRLEHTFNGLQIRHAGYYGEAGGPWLKTSGEKRAA